MFWFVAVIFSFFLQLVSTQNRSPCPDVFTYEPGGSEPDRWYGRIKLTTDVTLTGLWLRIGLDWPAQLLGNWFAESTSENNQMFVIKSRSYELEPNRPVTIRFFVKYDTEGPIPLLAMIRLNGRTICSVTVEESVVTTLAPFVSEAKTNAASNGTPTSNNQARYQIESTSEGYSDAPIPQPSSAPVAEQHCGTAKIPVLPLITHGDSSTEGEWPWHAAVYRNRGIRYQYICGGNLITPNHVLTVASCVTKPKTVEPFNADLFIVYLGKYSLYRLGPNVQHSGVQEISVHPKFNATYLYNDIAVLRLDGPALISDFVRTICLWEEDVGLSSIVGKLGTVVGWGYNQDATVTENLMRARMPVVTTEMCIFSNRDFFSLFTSDKSYCAGFKNGTSACIGDSGGGMVFPKQDSGRNTVWQLRGMVSVTAVAKTKIICDTLNYIVFTDVAKYLDWIRNLTKS